MDVFKNERNDNAKIKRVELHCHTKMSTLDGISTAEEIIDLAQKWGMDAIAISDFGNIQAFPDIYMTRLKMANSPKVILGVVGSLEDEKGILHDVSLLVKNEVGKKNLFQLISEVDCEGEEYKLRFKRKLLEGFREGILVGASCKNGEVYHAITVEDADIIELERTASYYDFLEICPPDGNDESSRNLVFDIIEIGKRTGKTVAAVGDVHYVNPGDSIGLDMLREYFCEFVHETGNELYLRTTEEMLDAFRFLGKKTAEEVVVTNTRAISEMIEDVCPIRPDKCQISIAEADAILYRRCYERLKELYPASVPEFAEERLIKELGCISNNGYSSLYTLAMKQCDRSKEAGYLVGTRGGIAGSFVAYLAGISSVNPLTAHYYCPRCGYYELAGDKAHIGLDLKEMECPGCGEKLERQGCSIPFEPFGGFEGNKEPDINLNFSYEYHKEAIKNLSNIFGAGRMVWPGQILRTDYEVAGEIIREYCKAHDLILSEEEKRKIKILLEGVRITDGIRFEGVIALPPSEDRTSFTPIVKLQRGSNVYEVSHFPYYSIDHNLTKVDCLINTSPTMLHYLKESTGVELKLTAENSREVLSLFDERLLDVSENNSSITFELAGIPEFDTKCVLQVLNEVRPESIDDIIRIVSLAHSEGAWKGNADELLKGGIANLSDVISSRDDIMMYLIKNGIDVSISYKIMETVRKGLACNRKSEKWNEYKRIMRDAIIPEWYIESCEKIKYLFPRAHSASYVLMSCQIALYKIRYPEAFRRAHFTVHRFHNVEELLGMQMKL